MCQAHRSDVPRMAEVLAASFEEEELHARLFPYRKEYPNYVDAWRRLIWEHWWDYSRVFMVSYVIEDEKPVDEQESDVPMALFTRKKRQENEVLVGVAEWKREGPGGRAFGTFQVGGIQVSEWQILLVLCLLEFCLLPVCLFVWHSQFLDIPWPIHRRESWCHCCACMVAARTVLRAQTLPTFLYDILLPSHSQCPSKIKTSLASTNFWASRNFRTADTTVDQAG